MVTLVSRTSWLNGTFHGIDQRLPSEWLFELGASSFPQDENRPLSSGNDTRLLSRRSRPDLLGELAEMYSTSHSLAPIQERATGGLCPSGPRDRPVCCGGPGARRRRTRVGGEGIASSRDRASLGRRDQQRSSRGRRRRSRSAVRAAVRAARHSSAQRSRQRHRAHRTARGNGRACRDADGRTASYRPRRVPRGRCSRLDRRAPRHSTRSTRRSAVSSPVERSSGGPIAPNCSSTCGSSGRVRCGRRRPSNS